MYLEEVEKMNFEELKELIIDLAAEKEQLHPDNAKKQFKEFVEASYEFNMAMVQLSRLEGVNKKLYVEDVKTTMGLMLMDLTILCEQLKIDPVECVEMVYLASKDLEERNKLARKG